MPTRQHEQSYQQHRIGATPNAAGTRAGRIGRSPTRGKWAVGFAIGFFGVAGALPTPGLALANPSAAHAESTAVTDDWMDELLDLLCYLYILYGGDCADFDNLGLDEEYFVLAGAILSVGSANPPSPELATVTFDIEDIIEAHAVDIDYLWGAGLAQAYLDLMVTARAHGP